MLLYHWNETAAITEIEDEEMLYEAQESVEIEFGGK